MSRRLMLLVLGTALGTAVAVTAAVTPAAAAKATVPAPPHGERVVAVGRHSVTVALPRAANADRYRLYVSTRRSDLAVSRIAHARHSAATRTPRLTVGHLPFTTARYYWRVRTVTGSRSRYGRHIGAVALRPAAPTAVRARSWTAGTWLSWRGAATGYEVVQARNARLTSGARKFTLRGATARFTPYGTVTGHRYWYRVRTVNGGTPSRWSRTVHTVVRSRAQPFRLMTYNVLTSKTDGTRAGDGVVAPWSRRRAGVLALVRRATPDILCLQEAGGWVGQPQAYGGRRQVDDLLTSLKGFALARTETPPSEHYYQRFGNYVLYRTSRYRELGTRGHWDLGEGRTAAYQLLQQRRTGARLLATSVHLMYGAGRPGDDLRTTETRRLLRLAGATARSVRAAVVYAGDFNSAVNRNHAYDGPGLVMRAAGVVDAQRVAQRLTNAAYNSANQYFRKPLRVGQSIDYVYAPPGVSIASWAMLLGLRHGRFPGVIPSDHNPLLVTGTYPY